MRFQTLKGDQDTLGARLEDVAQEAIDATASAHANDAGIDVEQHLQVQLAARGIAAADEDTLAELGRGIRAGHPPSVGRPDGSVGDRPAQG